MNSRVEYITGNDLTMSQNIERTQAIDEDTLLIGIANEDIDSLRRLYDLMHRAVFAYALSILKDREEAEDVMQDCFLKIRSAAHLYEPRGKARAWIFKIVSNLCMMKLRSRRKQISSPIEELHDLPAFEDCGDATLRATLEAAFRVLSDDDRGIIVLHAVSGLTFRQIAGIRDMPLATVLSRYHRGLAKLRKELEGKL